MSAVTEEEVRRIVEAIVSKIDVPSGKRVALGSDHGGFELKNELKKGLSAAGFEITDVGTHSKEPVDYPDIAGAVAKLVAAKKADRGIVLDGAGIGSSIAANKIRGVRAALCYNEKTIVNSRAHNDANVLTMGAPYHTPDEALRLALLWLNTEYEGGRHQNRIDKISELEKSNG